MNCPLPSAHCPLSTVHCPLCTSNPNPSWSIFCVCVFYKRFPTDPYFSPRIRIFLQFGKDHPTFGVPTGSALLERVCALHCAFSVGEAACPERLSEDALSQMGDTLEHMEQKLKIGTAPSFMHKPSTCTHAQNILPSTLTLALSITCTKRTNYTNITDTLSLFQYSCAQKQVGQDRQVLEKSR